MNALGKVLAALPAWVTPEAQQLVERIIAADPNLPDVDQFSEPTLRGGDMGKLQRIYDAWFMQRMDLCNRVPFGSDEYHRRRDFTIAEENPFDLVQRRLVAARKARVAA